MKNYIQPDLIYVLYLIIFLSACNKEIYPSVKINTPVNNQVFTAPERIAVSARMLESDQVSAEYMIVTKQNATNDTVLNIKEYVQTNEYIMIHDFLSEPNATYKIVVTAHGGHGNTAGDTVFVRAN